MVTFILPLLGVLISMVIGMVWHMPNIPTGKLHMDFIGFSKLSKSEQEKIMNDMKPHMWKSFLGQAVLSFFSSLFIVFVLDQTVKNHMSPTMVYAYILMIWFGFIIPTIGSGIIWGSGSSTRVAWLYFFSEILCSLVTYSAIIYGVHFFF